MASAEQMRDRASQLFAMALRARPTGQIDHTGKLTKLAWDALDQATALDLIESRNAF
jgi:YD repeat-containing protein